MASGMLANPKLFIIIGSNVLCKKSKVVYNTFSKALGVP